MRVTTYTYPWDLARLGVERTLAQMAADGINAVDLAATYHPIDTVSPRGGFSLFSDARGAVYFPARTERYGRIKPHMHSPEQCAVWPEAARHAGKFGLTLNAWTITLFQPWIRDAHPDCARVLPSGDRSGSGVCAANADLREYLCILSADVADQFDIDLVRLEGVLSPMYDLDWLRPRVLVPVSPLARTLLNLCFCGACTGKAAAAGIDAERLRRFVMETIVTEIEEGQTDASADRAARVTADPELRAFAAQYVQSSVDLVRAVRARLGGKARISTNAGTPFPQLLGQEAEDALLAQFVDAADQIALHPANPHGNRRVVAINSGMAAPRELSMLFARIQAPGAAGAAHTAGNAAEQLALDLQEAAERQVDEVTLYAYALIREQDAADFIAAVRKAFP
jgi:hypothetical protein